MAPPPVDNMQEKADKAPEVLGASSSWDAAPGD